MGKKIKSTNNSDEFDKLNKILERVAKQKQIEEMEKKELFKLRLFAITVFIVMLGSTWLMYDKTDPDRIYESYEYGLYM